MKTASQETESELGKLESGLREQSDRVVLESGAL
jgi:hypothetical protein